MKIYDNVKEIVDLINSYKPDVYKKNSEFFAKEWIWSRKTSTISIRKYMTHLKNADFTCIAVYQTLGLFNSLTSSDYNEIKDWLEVFINENS